MLNVSNGNKREVAAEIRWPKIFWRDLADRMLAEENDEENGRS